MKELEFIDYIAKQFKTGKSIIKGIGDDSAVLRHTKKSYLLLTTDMIIEGTHFSKNARPFEIGWKAMAVNISDIAAMGGIPKYALISVGVPKKRGTKFLKEIMRGIKTISKKFKISIIGGDTNSSSKVVLNIMLAGEVEKHCIVTRKGAKPGDLIFVTGALGEGKTKHLNFMPRLKEARTLVKNYKINSMIDLSDGLSVDLNRLAKISRVGARIHESLLPLSEKSEPLKKAIAEGEDFELLFTASRNESKKLIKDMGKTENLPITLVGEVVKKSLGVKLVEECGKLKPLKPKGFKHF